MARGWESKSVEAQIEAKPAHHNGNAAPKSRTPEQVQHLIEKRTLELARTKVEHALERSQNERYSQMLQQSLADLDKKIAALK